MGCDDVGGVHTEAAEAMKRARTIVWMVLAIAALAGLRVALTARSSGRSARLVRESVLAAAAERATGFIVRREGEAPVVLEERDGAWRICAPFEGAAAESVVKKLGDALAFREVEDALSDAELLRLGRARGDFGLEEPRLTVEVCAEGLTNEVYFGGATAAGAGVYAAIGGSDLVYVVPTSVVAAVDLAAADFRLRARRGRATMGRGKRARPPRRAEREARPVLRPEAKLKMILKLKLKMKTILKSEK